MSVSCPAFCTAVLLAVVTHAAVMADVVAPPLPSTDSASDVYALTANGRPVPVVRFSVDYDYAVAAVGPGACRFTVTRLDGKAIGAARVSPLKLNVAVATDGAAARFELDGPRYLIVDAPGLRRLVIAADRPEEDMPPRTGPHAYDITAGPYRADGTGGRPATAAVQQAIDAAGRDPSRQGVVYVPAGVYRVSELTLPSDVSLYLAAGAVLRCDGAAADFHITFRKTSIGRSGFWFIRTATGAHDVRIYGRGTIDGDGVGLLKRVGLLNHLVAVLDCTRFRMDGVVLRDSGLWGTVLGNSRDVTLTHCKHFNRLDHGEDDCVDVCNCQDVTIDRSIAVSLDDPYSIKTWEPTTDVASQWPGAFDGSRNVGINDCLAWTRCFGFKVGAGVLRDQQDIRITRAVVFDAAHAFGISHSYGAADVRGVRVDDLDVERTGCDCLGRSWARFVIDNRNKTSSVGGVSDVLVRDVRVRDAGTTPVTVQGLNATRRLRGITFEHVVMPASNRPATTLGDIGVRETPFADDVRVVP